MKIGLEFECNQKNKSIIINNNLTCKSSEVFICLKNK